MTGAVVMGDLSAGPARAQLVIGSCQSVVRMTFDMG